MVDATFEPLSVSSFLTIHVVSFDKTLFFHNISQNAALYKNLRMQNI